MVEVGIRQWEIDLILRFQESGDWLEPVMDLFSLLGFSVVYVLIAAILYWSVDSRLGQRLALFAFFSGSINETLKRGFHSPRPYWIESEIRPLGRVSTSFAFPSGHAQTSPVWILIGERLRTRWGWILSLLIMFMIGLSRIYLGAHSPLQVVAGWIIGLLLMAMCFRYEKPVIAWFFSKPLRKQLLIVLSVTLGMLMIGGGVLLIQENWQDPDEWVTNAEPHLEEDETLDPMDPGVLVETIGAFAGTATGIVLMGHFGGHDSGGPAKIRGLRVVFGTILTLLIYIATTALGESAGINDSPYLLHWSWEFLTAFLVLFSVFCPVPLMFRRYGL